MCALANFKSAPHAPMWTKKAFCVLYFLIEALGTVNPTTDPNLDVTLKSSAIQAWIRGIRTGIN